jgi:hypothetical protein
MARILVILLVNLFFFQVNSQSLSCDNVCVTNLSCKTGACVLTQCSSTADCFQFCLNCFGKETCYGKAGTLKDGCDYSTLVRVKSNGLQINYSNFFLCFCVFSFFLFKNNF